MELTPADIRTAWDAIRPGLAEIKTATQADWRLEDIYSLCLFGKASLYTVPEGFAILVRMENEWTGEPYLLALACHGEGNVQERYWPQIQKIATDAGCKAVKCFSPRRGFERAGWTVEYVCYRRDVNDG